MSEAEEIPLLEKKRILKFQLQLNYAKYGVIICVEKYYSVCFEQMLYIRYVVSIEDDVLPSKF